MRARQPICPCAPPFSHSRPAAIAGIFVACATLIPRRGRTYGEWLLVVTATFKDSIDQIEKAGDARG